MCEQKEVRGGGISGRGDQCCFPYAPRHSHVVGRRKIVAYFTETPGFVIGEQSFKKAVVKVMAGADAVEMANQRRAGEIEIAEGIKNFVTHEFIFVAKTVFVENLTAADDHGVV